MPVNIVIVLFAAALQKADGKARLAAGADTNPFPPVLPSPSPFPALHVGHCIRTLGGGQESPKPQDAAEKQRGIYRAVFAKCCQGLGCEEAGGSRGGWCLADLGEANTTWRNRVT